MLPVAVVIVRIETVSRRPLMVEVVAHKDLGRDGHLFLPKHLLQTASGIECLERNLDFYQPKCAGYEYLKSHPSATLS
jgi:hypothetical protein